MINKKPILNEIIRLLNYLQENDAIQEKLNPIIIFGKEKFDNRIIKLCQEGGYTRGDHNNGWEITIKGIQFLEEHHKIKTRQKQIDIQNILTLSLFVVAFLQGMLILIYNYLDLKIRNVSLYANIYMISGLLFLGFITWGFIKIKKQNE